MEPLTVNVARELAEEIRTNTKLRHRLGMDEGCYSAQLEAPKDDTIEFSTVDGETFTITVEHA